MARPFGAIVSILAALVVPIGCSTPIELGVFRMPVQTGERSLALRTMLARLEGEELVLRDAVADAEFGRALARGSWMGELQPYRFGKQNGYPLTLFVRDGVMEDVEQRPYETQPVPPLVTEARLSVITLLATGGEKATLLRAGGMTFADGPLASPASDRTPSVLQALGSISGGGIVLRDDAVEGAEWKDAVSTLVPLARTRPMMCGAPFRSLYRSLPNARADVPAGSFDAVHTTEIIDACPDSPEEPGVWSVERWFAPGTGPVQIFLTLDDGKTREYRLVATNASGDPAALWPLQEGFFWEFEVTDGDGAQAGTTRLEVVGRKERGFPED